MAIKIISTTQAAIKKIKVLVYGPAGVGKTRLCATAEKPLILSAEGGLLSLSEQDIPVIEITTMGELEEAYLFLKNSEEAKKYKTPCLDSISDIAEVCLATEKAGNKDARNAYGELNTKMSAIIRAFRDLPSHDIYFTAKVQRLTDDMGVTQFVPSMPGKALVAALPYFFDEVLAMRTAETDEGKAYSYLQTSKDIYWEAKDRSGKLDFMEEPHLGKLFAKMRGEKGVEAKPTKTVKPKKEEKVEVKKDDIPF